MAKKACIFIDGENLRHNIVNLFANEFEQSDYLPKNGRWSELFDHLVQRATNGESYRLRTYWYVVDKIDFLPYKIPQESEKLKKLLSRHEPYRQRFNQSADVQEEERHIQDILEDISNNQRKMTKRFEGWSYIHNKISTDHDAIEFRPAGSITYDLFTNSFLKEKAVDVKLAVDLIELNEIYDTAIIVSGDQDYVPAVKAIKDKGKHVVNVAFKTKGGKLFPGGAWGLNAATDRNLEIDYYELKEYLFLRSN